MNVYAGPSSGGYVPPLPGRFLGMPPQAPVQLSDLTPEQLYGFEQYLKQQYWEKL